jgi:serine/threonine protein kinase
VIALRGYELQHELHQGLISLVYGGVRSSDGLRVIVKILRNEYPTDSELRRYQREFTIASALVSPAVVRPLSLERANHRLALIYEDTGSMSLRHTFRGSALPLGRWLEIAIAITDTLHDLHSHGVIHKDL